VLIVNVNIAWYNGFVKKENSYIRFVILIAIAYLLFVVGKTLYQSYQVRKQIDNMEVSITKLQQTNRELSEKLLYYQSPSYAERIARERLGLQKPGEEVIVILPEKVAKVEEKDPYDKLSNQQKWWNFFFNS
jgi:cell division protein FtsB